MQQQKLDSEYWNKRYQNGDTGWDVGRISDPLKAYVDQLKDKNISILIPGCGNAYEATYLLQHGFTDVTLIDISPSLVDHVKRNLSAYLGKELKIICGDFFELDQHFDLILEQTFFCALDPSLRNRYAEKMHSLLNPGGKIAGVLFNRNFDGGPPFGGTKAEYEKIFSVQFKLEIMEECYNSISPRKGNELFIKFLKV